MVAHALGEVDGLRTDLWCLHRHFASATSVESTVATHLEVGDGSLCNNSLAKWNFLLLCLVVIRYNLVHTALLKIYRLWLWYDEVGVNFLLRLVEGIGKDYKC